MFNLDSKQKQALGWALFCLIGLASVAGIFLPGGAWIPEPVEPTPTAVIEDSWEPEEIGPDDFKPQAVRERIGFDSRVDSYFYNGADLYFYSDNHSTSTITMTGDTGAIEATTFTVTNFVTSSTSLDLSGNLTVQGALYTSFADLAVSDGDTITPTYTTYALDSSGAVTVTLAASAQEGQLLVLIGDDANDITIADTNLRSNDGNAQVLNQYDVLMLVYQDSEWLEISESNDS